jgi:hypothetical protein
VALAAGGLAAVVFDGHGIVRGVVYRARAVGFDVLRCRRVHNARLQTHCQLKSQEDEQNAG